MRISATILCSVLWAPVAALAGQKAIDDRQIESRFVELISKRLDENKGVAVKELRDQLKKADRTTRKLAFAKRGKEKLTPAQIYEKRRESVVALGNIYKCDKCDDWHPNLAGGVILTADGVALTNHHVVADSRAKAFGAITADGKVHGIKEVLAASRNADLALVQLDGEGFVPAPLAVEAPVGSPVTVISHPDGRFYTLTTGYISRYFTQHAKGAKRHRVAITADYARGSSGCPVFDEHGSVVALVSTTSSIYYNRSKDVQKNLQMVIKASVPMSELRGLLPEKSSSAE